MQLWEGRAKKKRGRPATGQGETLYIPVNSRTAVSQIIDRDIPDSGNIYISAELLDKVKKIIE